MADPEHLEIIRQGADVWKEWRKENLVATVDLSQADLTAADLSALDLINANLTAARLHGADLRRTDLQGAALNAANLAESRLNDANLRRADLRGAKLSDADLSGAALAEAKLARADLRRARLFAADLRFADLLQADLRAANLVSADLRRAYLSGAELDDADLTGADLIQAQLVETRTDGAIFAEAKVYGVAAWNLVGRPADQTNLVISGLDEAVVTVDDLEVAQFMHLMIHNDKLRGVIDTITSKLVLILGRFSPQRKVVLDALRNELRQHNLVPVLFDFDAPAGRDVSETVTLLARMARFIVADLTDPASIPLELQAIAGDVAVPIQPIVHEDQEPFSMFATLLKYPWVLEPYEYRDLDGLVSRLAETVLAPAEAKREELAATRRS